ncbi:uncharacterized protein J4E79_009313 [Alternaria viburni]|uniref:uncharacterized protein n=1 Tax=Alternaria viburni TaxID=566460 RepID=UPI0020C23D15|nr:uncharacterized protein J4E79_009313 [Alternaria viburni]KAI4651116.1 hypothetical protein J4E79_009313 [Alternaria viburni]
MATKLMPSRHTIHMLLKSQRKLKELNFRIRPDEAFAGKGPLPIRTTGPLMEPPLKDLTGLAVYVHCYPTLAKSSFEYYRKLLPYVPKLQTLSIEGTLFENRPLDRLDMHHILQHDIKEPILTSLTTLRLKLIDLGMSHKVIFSNMNFANLRTLSLIGCNDMAPFFGGLLVQRANSDSSYLSRLSDLEIFFPSNSPHPYTDIQAVQRFLETGPKLDKLILDVSRHALINKDAIIAQSKLKSLELGTGEERAGRSYAVEDVKAILAACSELADIAINLPAANLGSLIDLAHDFRLGRPQNCLTHVETEFEAMLTVLAQHTPLHTLRILNLPIFGEIEIAHKPDSLNATERRLARILYKNYVTEIMRFMARCGTAPIVFDTRPSITYQIFDECIRQKKDQGVVCLVSRSWRELMAPILWEKLEFSLGDHQGSSPGRSLTTLLDPNSGILPHVRNLCFADFTDEDAENRLESLILALPRDKLRVFQAYGDMQHELFLQLLRSQTKLESFYATTPFTCLGSTSDYHYASREYRAWVASLTPELKEISLLLEREEEDEEEEVEKNHRNLQSFIDLYPSLERLNLSADCDPPISLQELLSLSPESRLFSNLTSIKMEAMSLVPDALYQFSHNFDVARLEKLHLKDCSSMSLFFDSLSESYIETPGKLRELCIRLDNGVEDEVQVETTTSIENFLKVCCARLENLELHLSNGKLVDKSCLLPHAETLRNVIIEKSQYGIPDSQSHYYSGDEVGVILRACTKLRGLAINLPPIDLGHITELGDFQFKASERDCAAFKDVLSSYHGNTERA